MRIDKLAPSAHVQGRWLCHLEDGTILRIGENEVALFGLYSGMELSGEKTEALREAGEQAAVLDKALSLLSARPLSRKELVDKLTAQPRSEEKQPIREELAQAAADRLEELGYLNDAEYARTVVRHYSAKGYGERKLRDELWKRGVPRELWDEALEEIAGSGEAIDRFLAQKLRNWSGDRKELKRATDALARRGFSWSEISDALGRYEISCEENGEE